MKARIVISAASAHQPWVKVTIKELLGREEFKGTTEDDVTLDLDEKSNQSIPGSKMKNWVQAARNSDVIIVFVDDHSLASAVCCRQFLIAQASRKAVIVSLAKPETLKSRKDFADSTRVLDYLNNGIPHILTRAGPGFNANAVADDVTELLKLTDGGDNNQKIENKDVEFEVSSSGYDYTDGTYRLGGKCAFLGWYEHTKHHGIKIVYAFGRWCFPTPAVRSLYEDYAADLNTDWHRNPGAACFFEEVKCNAVHMSDLHSNRPPCKGWVDGATGETHPLLISYR